jgi:hypothetical protein
MVRKIKKALRKVLLTDKLVLKGSIVGTVQIEGRPINGLESFQINLPRKPTIKNSARAAFKGVKLVPCPRGHVDVYCKLSEWERGRKGEEFQARINISNIVRDCSISPLRT